MITLEQIQRLDGKVKKAVEIIDHLKRENQSLRGELGEYEKRISELEILIEHFKDDQKEIEEKILHALSQLDHIEYEITERGRVLPEEKKEPVISETHESESGPTSPPLSSSTDEDSDPSEPEDGGGKDSIELDIF